MKTEISDRLEELFQTSEDVDNEFVERLFEDEKNDSNLKNVFRNKWMEILNSKAEKLKLDHILYKIHFDINMEENSYRKPKVRTLYAWSSRIAVILFIPLIVFSTFIYLNSIQQATEFTEIITPYGEKAQFVLPDGSTGYLNSGSKLKYSGSFMQDRKVYLEGEGFFDVVHDKSTFVVELDAMKVEVYGTKFNVCAYQSEHEVYTTLEEGEVIIVNKIGNDRMELKPGEQAVFRRLDSQIISQKVDVDLFVSWKENKLRFKNSPFIDVVKKMERWYDVDIILEEELNYLESYTMTIKTESLREMMDLIALTTPMKYEIKEDAVYITNK